MSSPPSADRPMRIALASETYPPDVNGAANFVDHLARGLAGRGHDVHVICPRHPDRSDAGDGGQVRLHEVASVRVPRYPWLRCAALPRSSWQIGERLCDVAPDVVHVHNHFFVGRAVLRFARRAGVATVATNHFVPEHLLVNLPAVLRPAYRRIEAALWRDLCRAYGGADHVVAPTPSAAALLEEHGFGRPVGALSCGVDTVRFRPGIETGAVRAEYGLGTRPTVLAVGRLDPDKRLDVLIDALALVRRRIDAQLVIVGRGGRLEALRARARGRGVDGAVVFTGYVRDADLPAMFSAADVYANAGTAELQSISTLEALACGKPVVLAAAGALPLLVQEGRNGHAFPPGNAEAAAAGLVEVLAVPSRAAAFGRESLRLARRHEFADTVRAHEQLYACAVTDRRRDRAVAPVAPGTPSVPLSAPGGSPAR